MPSKPMILRFHRQAQRYEIFPRQSVKRINIGSDRYSIHRLPS